MNHFFSFGILFIFIMSYSSNIFAQELSKNAVSSRETSFLQHAKILEEVNLPLIERDSLFSYDNQEWYYGQDGVHQYYSHNCKDSIIIYSENGVNTYRYIFHYDEFNNIDYQLTQTWIVNFWEDQYEYQSTVQPTGCLTDYLVDRSWNGSSWDTTYGLRENVTYNSAGNPSVRTYTKYSNGEWVNNRQIKES